MSKPIKKIRKGLVLLIRGLIEETELMGELIEDDKDSAKETLKPYTITDGLRLRTKEIEELFSDAETYDVSKGKLEKLKSKYDSLKARIKDFK